jgi:uncharacterized coiled-coil protein SlyX
MNGRHSRGWGLALILVLTGMGLGLLGGITDGPRGNKGPETVFAIIAVGAMYFALFRGPVGKAVGRMLEGDPPTMDDDADHRMYELESRVAELSADQLRIAELEERLDFAERLLAQRHDAPEFPTHRTPS